MDSGRLSGCQREVKYSEGELDATLQSSRLVKVLGFLAILGALVLACAACGASTPASPTAYSAPAKATALPAPTAVTGKAASAARFPACWVTCRLEWTPKDTSIAAIAWRP